MTHKLGTGLAIALLAAGCGPSTDTGGGGGGADALPVPLPSGFFQNGVNAATVRIVESPTLDGLQVRVMPSGEAYVTQPNTGSVRSGVLPQALTTRFFQDLVAAQPLDQHLAGTCDGGTMWGNTPITVDVGGPPSPSLLCPGDSAMRALHDDTLSILGYLHVQPVPLASPTPAPGPLLGASPSVIPLQGASPTAAPSASPTAKPMASGTASATASPAASPSGLGSWLPSPRPAATGVPGLLPGEGSILKPFIGRNASNTASPNPYFE